MNDHVIAANQIERARLLPVLGAIVATCITILGVAYVVGNLIYQIP